MGCFLAIGALFVPRFVIFLLWLFTDYLSRAFDTWLVADDRVLLPAHHDARVCRGPERVQRLRRHRPGDPAGGLRDRRRPIGGSAAAQTGGTRPEASFGHCPVVRPQSQAGRRVRAQKGSTFVRSAARRGAVPRWLPCPPLAPAGAPTPPGRRRGPSKPNIVVILTDDQRWTSSRRCPSSRASSSTRASASRTASSPIRCAAPAASRSSRARRAGTTASGGARRGTSTAASPRSCRPRTPARSPRGCTTPATTPASSASTSTATTCTTTRRRAPGLRAARLGHVVLLGGGERKAIASGLRGRRVLQLVLVRRDEPRPSTGPAPPTTQRPSSPRTPSTSSTQSPPNKPLFLYYTPHAPHGPTQPDKKYKGTCDDQQMPMPPSFNEAGRVGQAAVHPEPAQAGPGEDQQEDASSGSDACSTLRSIDDSVGAILDELQATGRLDNTLILYASDNGLSYGEHRVLGKAVPYEESIRVPLIIRYDPVTAGVAGETADEQVVNLDYASTLADAAGVDPGPAPGRPEPDAAGGGPVGHAQPGRLRHRAPRGEGPGPRLLRRARSQTGCTRSTRTARRSSTTSTRAAPRTTRTSCRTRPQTRPSAPP